MEAVLTGGFMICTLTLLLGMLAPSGPEALPGDGEETWLPRSLAEAAPAPRRRGSRTQQEDEAYPRPDRISPVVRGTAPGDIPNAFALHASFEWRAIQGSTQVRERDSHPALLDLDGDLGFGTGGGFRFAISKDTSKLRFFLDLELVYGTGQGQLDKDFQFDEGSFKAGIPFDVDLTAFFARPGLAIKNVFGSMEHGWIGLYFGLEYPRMNLGISQPGAGEASEEQFSQFMPYPVFGLAAHLDLSGSISFEARAFAGYVPSIGTPFTEGGQLKMSVETFNIEAELRWKVTRNIAFTLGAGYQYWHGMLTSNEDGNDLKLTCPQLTVGIEIRF